MVVRELITLLGYDLKDGPMQKYDQQIDRAKTKSNSLAKAAGGIGTAYKIAAAAVAVGVGWISKNIIEGTVKYEGYRQQIQAFTGDAESAAAALAGLRDKKIDALFGSGVLVDSYKQLRTLGMDTEQTSRMIDVLGDIANGSAENFNALNNVLVRASTTGKVNSGTMRQLAQAGFGAQDMAQGLGISVEKLNADLEAGRIGYKDLTRAMQGATMEGGRFYQNAANQALTLGGSIKVLKSLISDFSDAIGMKVAPALANLIGYITDLVKLGQSGLVDFGAKAFDYLIHIIAQVIIFFEVLQMRMKKYGGAFEPLKAIFRDVFGLLKSVLQSAQPLLMNLATALLTAFRPIQAFIAPVIKALKPIFAEVFGYLADLVAGLIPIINGLTPVFRTIGNIVGVIIRVFATGAMTVIKALTPIAGVILAIVAAIKIWTAIQWLLNIAMNANPIGLIILAIVALIGIITLLVKNFDKVKEFFANIGKAIAGFFVGLWNAIVGIFQKIGAFIKENAVNILNIILTILFFPAGIIMAVVRLIIKHWDKIKAALVKVFTFVANKAKSIWGGIVNIVRGIVDRIKDIWAAITSFFLSLFDRIKVIISNVWDGMVGIVTGVVDRIKEVWNGIIIFFTGLWDSLKEGPTAALEYIKNAFLGLFDNIKEKFFGFISIIQSGWEKVKGFFGGVKDTVVNFVTGGNDDLKPEPVNDMILTPGGGYSTHPDDYILAMKRPQDLLDALLKNLAGPQLQPAFAQGGFIGNAMNTAGQKGFNTSSYESHISAPINVNVNASGMSPEAASMAVKRGVEDALREAISGSRGSIPSPEARRN